MRNATDALRQCGYIEHGDTYRKSQYLVGLEAEVFERVIEIKGCYKESRKAAQLVTHVPGTYREKETSEIVDLITRVENAVERAVKEDARDAGMSTETPQGPKGAIDFQVIKCPCGYHAYCFNQLPVKVCPRCRSFTNREDLKRPPVIIPAGDDNRSAFMVLDAEGAKRSATTAVSRRAKGLLDILSDEERLDIFTEYCRACGSKDPKCQCWNDE